MALPAPSQSQYLGRVMNASEKMQILLLGTVDTKAFGVPFIYHHIVHLLTNLYLILLSVSNVFVDSDSHMNFWAIISYPIICFVTLGESIPVIDSGRASKQERRFR